TDGVASRSKRALILMYHRVSSEPDYLGLCVSPANIDRHLSLLRRFARIVPLRELVQRISDFAEPLRANLAAVTFDDGYRDNLDIGQPILARHEIPATVFVTTDFADHRRVPMGERLQHAVEALWRGGARPTAWDGVGNERFDGLIRAVLRQPGVWPPL